jgi:hypothetical protein
MIKRGAGLVLSYILPIVLSGDFLFIAYTAALDLIFIIVLLKMWFRRQTTEIKGVINEDCS